MKRITVAAVLLLAVAAAVAYPTVARMRAEDRMRTAIDRFAPDSLAEIIELADRGVDLRTTGYAGGTVAMVAAFRSDPALLKRALDAGVDPNAADPTSGTTALMSAMFAVDPDVTRLLLAAGADVNRRNRDGDTALMFAVRNSRHDLIPLLLAAGAKVDIANAKGETALSLAKALPPTGSGLWPMRPDLTPADFVRILENGGPKN